MQPDKAYVLLKAELPMREDKMREEFNVEAVRTMMNYYTLNQMGNAARMANILRQLKQYAPDNMAAEINSILRSVPTGLRVVQ